jgi:hypothetical protein
MTALSVHARRPSRVRRIDRILKDEKFATSRVFAQLSLAVIRGSANFFVVEQVEKTKDAYEAWQEWDLNHEASDAL